jgi:hypothetical protein
MHMAGWRSSLTYGIIKVVNDRVIVITLLKHLRAYGGCLGS